MTSNISWQVLETGKVFDLINGYAFKSKEFLDSGAPVLKIKNVKAGMLSLSNLAYVDEEFLKAKPEKIAQFNDLLISMSGNRHDGSMETWVGKVCWFGLDTQYLINQRVGILRLKPSIDANPRFLAYQLSSESFQRHFIAVATSSGGQANLSPAQIKSTELLLPPRSVQDWIVSVAGALEDKIQINRQINQTLEQMAQAIFKSWFVDFEPVKAKIAALDAGGTEEDALLAAMQVISGKDADQLTQMQAEQPEQYAELRATAELFPSTMQDSELGEIPEGWTVGNLADICGFQNGYAFKSKDWSDSGCAVVKIGSVKPGFVDLQSCSFVSEATVEKLQRFELAAGDILVGMTGYPGETGLVPEYSGRVFLNQRVGRFIPTTPEQKAFVYCTVRTGEFKQYVESQAHGSAQANVSGKAICQYALTLSPAALLDRFSRLVDPFVSKMLRLHSESACLSELRDSLLPKLLSGELNILQVMEDAEDE